MELVDKHHIQKLASSGEGDYVEFKRKVEDPEKIVKEIVAFANSKGGWLLIGVSDNGTIPGLTHPEGDWFVLEKAIKSNIKPQPTLTRTLVPISSTRSVIALEIESSKKKPHFFQKKSGSQKEVYVRYKDECIRASREWAEIMAFEHRRVFIRYGEEEKELLDYLAENEGITARDYRQLLKTTQRKASRILVKLTAANVLELKPGYGKEDRFVLKG